VEEPLAMFSTVPAVESIERASRPNVYRVTLREASGPAQTLLATVDWGDIPLVIWDPDLTHRWPGYAASLRALAAAVLDEHRRG
jgi:hypothetical protein